MASALCYIQETCPHFEGGKWGKTHYYRMKDPCKKSLDYSCTMYVELRNWHGETMACPIDKGKEIREKIKKEGKDA